MLLGVLAIMAITLTIGLFATRNVMLGFPATIFWAILGGHCYQESASTWDIYYLIFFASMGMAIFSMYAMYGLREQDLAGPNADEGKFFDEKQEPDLRGDIDVGKETPVDEKQGAYFDETGGSKPSARVLRLRQRAKKRRSG